MNTFQKIRYFTSPKEYIALIVYAFLILFSMSLDILSLGLLFPIVNLILDINFLNDYSNIKNFLIFISPLKFLNKGIYFEIISGALTCFIIVILFKNLFILYIEYYKANFAYRFLSRIKINLLKKIFSTQYFDLIKIKTSEFITFQTQITGIVTITENLIIIFTEILLLASIMLFLFFLDTLMSFYLVIIILFFSVLLIFFLKKKMFFLGEKRRQSDAQQVFLINNIFNCIKDIKLQNKFDLFIKNYDKTIKESLKAQKIFKFFSSIPRSYLELLLSISIVLYFILSFVFYADINKIVAMGAVFLVSGLRAMPSIGKIIHNFNNYKYHLPILNKIFNFCVNLEKLPNDEKIGINLKEGFELKNINFSFDKKQIFKDLNLSFKNTEKIGFYGTSGAGKSTLINILTGLLNPHSGIIKVDKKVIKNKFYLNNISLVSQLPFFINASIRENLIFIINNKKKISDNDIYQALEDVQLAKKISSLRNGLDTVIGEKGASFSGGELQRLSIARELIKNSDLLILDEATNAIDKSTEKKILDLIFSNYKNRCLILISHDINLLKRCDKTYELKNCKLEKIFLKN